MSSTVGNLWKTWSTRLWLLKIVLHTALCWEILSIFWIVSVILWHTHSSFLFPLHLIKLEIEDYFLNGVHTWCPSDIKLFHVEAVNGSSNFTPWLASSCSHSLISLLSLCLSDFWAILLWWRSQFVSCS